MGTLLLAAGKLDRLYSQRVRINLEKLTLNKNRPKPRSTWNFTVVKPSKLAIEIEFSLFMSDLFQLFQPKGILTFIPTWWRMTMLEFWATVWIVKWPYCYVRRPLGYIELWATCLAGAVRFYSIPRLLLANSMLDYSVTLLPYINWWASHVDRWMDR